MYRDGNEKLNNSQNDFSVSDGSRKPIRTWREIAEELSRETDSERLIRLSVELDKALETQMTQQRTLTRFS